MGLFSRIGQKFRSGVRMGQKFLKTAGSIGQKVASGFDSAYNAASGFPIIGHAIKSNPLVQGLRGVVGGVGTLGKMASGAADIIEKGTYTAKTAHALHGAGKQMLGQAKKVGREGSHLFNKGNHESNQGHTHHG